MYGGALATVVGTAPGLATSNNSNLAGSPTRSASDRKSTRLNSSHGYNSYAVFCLQKKNNQASHHVHIPLVTWSGKQSPTSCQPSLCDAPSGLLQSLSDSPVAFDEALFDSHFRHQQ